MDILQNLLYGLSIALTPENLLFCTLGGIAGILVGAMPGLGSVAGVALLLPLTFKMNPTTAIITLASIYYGNMFGGSISAILINIPGDAPAIMTALDGNMLAKKGRAGQALFTAFFSSFAGGLVGAVLLTFLGPLLAEVGLKFGPPEFAALIFLAMTSVGWVLGESPAKGLLATVFGLLLASIGSDSMSGVERMTFGSIDLIGGVPFIPFIIGVFGFSQVIATMACPSSLNTQDIPKISYKSSLLSAAEWARTWPAVLRSTFLGFFVGLLPGSGATTASFISYIAAKKCGKHGHELGTGAVEGVASAEAANNAASIGAFAPLLSLGIPGSGTAAILLGGLMMWGLQPGPLLMTEHKDFAWGLIGSIFVGDVIIALICLAALPVLANLLRVPNSILMPAIVVVSMVGAYSFNNNSFDVFVMLIGGMIGYLFTLYKYPVAPLALTLVLGPSLETAMRQSFRISQGDVSVFFTRPISLGMFAAAALFVILPVLYKTVKNKQEAA